FRKMSFRQDRRRHADDEMEVDAKRRRAPESQSELERRVVDLIMHIGEKPGQTSLESNLEKLVTLLEGELEKIGQRIIETIIECAKNLPDKLTIYSTLVGLLNAKNYNFGGEIVEKLVADLQQTLESEKHRHAANLVTFICDLANCKVLSLTSVVEFLEGLLEAASEDGVPQVRSDWFIYAVLRSLPWIGTELKEKKTEELENLLGGVDAYMQQRSRTHIRILQVWTGSTHEQEEYLDCLYEQVKLLAGAEWKEKHIARMYIAFDAVLTDALSHNLPTLAPPAHMAASAYPLPHVVFRLFDYADCPEDGPVLPGAHSIERHLIDDELGWIIDLNEMNRKDCAEALLNYTHRATVPLPYVVLETVFSRLFSLPDSPQPRLFYGALLIELCRLQPNTFPQVLAQAAELLYDRAHEMQPACLDRFVDWFSYHLSNFQYRWSWQDWNDCLEADALDNKFILAKEVLEKCMRFSYYERILEILPESHKRLQPAKPDVIYPMEDENHEEFERARHFQALFQEKLAADAMIEELRVEEQTGEGPEFDSRAFSVFFAVLLKLASKSFSHNFAALTRYHKTLKHVVANSPTMQQTLLSTLYGCWRNNTQMMLILIDKLLKMQILDCSVVVAWIFDGEDAQQEHSRQWLWEMLNNSLGKLGKHVAKCKKDLETLKEAKQRKEKARKEKEAEAQGEGEGKDDEKMEEGDDEAAAAEMDGEVLTKEAEVEALADAQKRIFLDVLMKFASALTTRLQEQGDGAEKSLWYTFVQGRMRHVFLAHEPVIREFAVELEQQLVAKTDLDRRAIQVFAEFAALRA
ncbi:ncbp-1, partial [Pristionchus pacificus]